MNSHSACVNPWKSCGDKRSRQPPAWSKLCGTCVPTCVSLPGAAWGIPQLVRLLKINSHFAFHPWLCGCSCVLSILTHSHCYFSLLLVVGGQVQNVRLWQKGLKRAIATPKTELMSNIQRKGVVRECSRKKGWEWASENRTGNRERNKERKRRDE